MYRDNSEAMKTKLDEIGNKNPFTVPEDYFAKFNAEIMSKLPEKEVVAPKKVTMWAKAKPYIYLAAMLLGLIFIINIYVGNNSKPQFYDDYWSNVDISEEEFYQYLEDQLIEEGYYDIMCDQIQFN